MLLRVKSGQNRQILMNFILFLTCFWPFDLGRRQNLVILPNLTLLKCILMENSGIEVWQFHWGLFLILNSVPPPPLWLDVVFWPTFPSPPLLTTWFMNVPQLCFWAYFLSILHVLWKSCVYTLFKIKKVLNEIVTPQFHHFPSIWS